MYCENGTKLLSLNQTSQQCSSVFISSPLSRRVHSTTCSSTFSDGRLNNYEGSAINSLKTWITGETTSQTSVGSTVWFLPPVLLSNGTNCGKTEQDLDPNTDSPKTRVRTGRGDSLDNPRRASENCCPYIDYMATQSGCVRWQSSNHPQTKASLQRLVFGFFAWELFIYFHKNVCNHHS